MAEDWGVTPIQIYWSTIALIGATAIPTLPNGLTRMAGQDGWLAALVALPAGAVPLVLWYGLDRRFPGRTLTEQARAVLGPYLGTVVALFPLLLFATSVGVTPREIMALVSAELPRTPAPVLLGLLMLAVLWMVRSGLETVARVGQIQVPAGIAVLFFLLAAVIKDMHPVSLLPVLGRGWRPVFQGAAMATSFYGQTIFLLYILPFREASRGASLRAALWGLASSSGLLALSTAALAALFGPLTPDLPFTVLQATFVVNIAEFVTHLDALFVALWLAFSLVKISLFFFCFCLALAQLLGLRDYRPLTLPAAAFSVVAAISWFQSGAQLVAWLGQIAPFFGGFLQVGPPLLIWAAALIRGGTAPSPTGGYPTGSPRGAPPSA